MTRLALLLCASLSGCAAVLGDYEVDPALDRTDARVDAPADTSVADTADASASIKSCKALLAGGVATDGPQTLGEGIRTFCDMRRGGYTLVAVRANNTNGEAWTNVPAAMRLKELGDPNSNGDRVLDVDWRTLGFTEVVYELGVTFVMMGPPEARSRVTFKNLTPAQQAVARDVLGRFPGGAERVDCYLDASPTPIAACEERQPPPNDPPNSFGWVYLSNKAACYWGFKGRAGAPDCTSGAVGGGRVWVK